MMARSTGYSAQIHVNPNLNNITLYWQDHIGIQWGVTHLSHFKCNNIHHEKGCIHVNWCAEVSGLTYEQCKSDQFSFDGQQYGRYYNKYYKISDAKYIVL